jgi:adenylate cyclase
MDLERLLTELRRRRVWRVVIAYGLVTFAVLQVIEPMLHALHLPDWVLSLAVLLLAIGFPVALAMAWTFDLRDGRVVRTPPEAALAAAGPVIAVLPFEDLSPGRDQGWFCSGMAEELLGALSALGGLRVVSRSSSFQFQGRAVDAREVGRALSATALLEGSVRRDGQRVRVAARLVDARQGIELWSGRQDREVADTFAVQEEIAQAVVSALRLTLTPGEADRLRKVGASRATRDPQVYELYLKGRHALRQQGRLRVLEAQALFRQAVALDAGFAQAHAGLADAAAFLLTWNLDPSRTEELRAEALRASDEALRLESQLAEASLARANVLTLLGRLDEALDEFRRAEALNPGWGDACYYHGRALVMARRYPEAVAAFEEAVRRDPDDYSSLAMIEGAWTSHGDQAAAREAATRTLSAVGRRLAISPDEVRALYFGAILEAGYGDAERGRALAERATALAGDDFATLYNLACFWARLGNRERALELLDRAVGDCRGSRAWMDQDPDFAPLRGDPRFEAILARVKG